jgi:murein DD-endopeptidase MepM/ murein hydrolase activator NlpD
MKATFIKENRILAIVIVILLLIVSSIFLYRNIRFVEYDVPEVFVDTIPEFVEPNLLYGFDVDSFYVEKGKVKRNQNLSDILSVRGVSYKSIDRLARNSKKIFDVRYIKAGNNYTVFSTPDSLRNPKFFVYEGSKTEYFVYELDTDSMKVIQCEKEIVSIRNGASGEISTSLWNTMKDNNLNPVLAIELADIFAWTIDFFGIQKGDKFKVIYDEEYVEDESIGIGNIYAVHFKHMDEDFFAYRFNQGGKDENGAFIDKYDFFDEKGNSLRKAFLKAPLKFSRISSRFSHSRMHPVLRIRRPHHGIDYAAPRGTPVYSIGEGVVTHKGYQKRGGGNYVKIKHNSVYRTVYMHLSRFGKGIRTGVRVKQGQVIGYVGSTGLATGPHLDYRVYKNGHPIDPLKVKAPPVEPVKKENISRFEVVRDSYENELTTIFFPDDNLATISK